MVYRAICRTAPTHLRCPVELSCKSTLHSVFLTKPHYVYPWGPTTSVRSISFSIKQLKSRFLKNISVYWQSSSSLPLLVQYSFVAVVWSKMHCWNVTLHKIFNFHSYWKSENKHSVRPKICQNSCIVHVKLCSSIKCPVLWKISPLFWSVYIFTTFFTQSQTASMTGWDCNGMTGSLHVMMKRKRQLITVYVTNSSGLKL